MWRLVANQKLRPTVVLAAFSGCTSVTATALCDDGGGGGSGKKDDKEFWEALLHKSSKGAIGWDKVRQDMGEGLFWDKLAKKAGHQVGIYSPMIRP
jgi:hypothetical protein